MEQTFQKLDNNTIRVTETKTVIVDVNINDLLARKAEYERIIKEIDERMLNATNNWHNEQEDCQNEIEKIDAIISECEKLDITSEKTDEVKTEVVAPEEKIEA